MSTVHEAGVSVNVDTLRCLPNGIRVQELNSYETDFLYQEIFEDRVYLRKGIVIPADATVIDIGANIGLFTAFIKQQAPQARVLAFEPSVETYPILRANCLRFGDSVTVLQEGISDRCGTAEFTFYPGYSLLSGFHAMLDADRELLAGATVGQLRRRCPEVGVVPHEAISAVARAKLDGPVKYKCGIRSLSHVIEQFALSSVDLVKIDAERCEFEILAGVSEKHWPRIRQIVMEVHHAEGAHFEDMMRLLQSKGFTVSSEAGDSDHGCPITVYASHSQ